MFTILVTTLIQGPEPRPKVPPPRLKEKFGLFNTIEDAAKILRLAGWDECGGAWLRSNPKDPKGKDPFAPSWTAEIIDQHKTIALERLPGICDDPLAKEKLSIYMANKK